MYFWKIKSLKERLKNNTIETKEYFFYLVAYSILYGISLILTVIQLYKTWGISMAIIQVLLFAGGIYYAYYSNGGAKGEAFLKRFFSIGWVFLLRATFFMSIGMLNLYVMTHLFGMEKMFTVNNSAIIGLLFEILFYWRIGKHIADLRIETSKTNIISKHN